MTGPSWHPPQSHLRNGSVRLEPKREGFGGYKCLLALTPCVSVVGSGLASVWRLPVPLRPRGAVRHVVVLGRAARLDSGETPTQRKALLTFHGERNERNPRNLGSGVCSGWPRHIWFEAGGPSKRSWKPISKIWRIRVRWSGRGRREVPW